MMNMGGPSTVRLASLVVVTLNERSIAELGSSADVDRREQMLLQQCFMRIDIRFDAFPSDAETVEVTVLGKSAGSDDICQTRKLLPHRTDR